MNNTEPGSDAAAIQILAHEILYEIGMPASTDLIGRLTARIEEALSQAVGRERERCLQLCRKRAAVWSSTAMALTPGGREESRARANEATYIGDLISGP